MVAGPSEGRVGTAETDGLLADLRAAIQRSPVRPRQVEVGVALSVALGRERGSVACGGCQEPLAVDGIPAVTNVHLREPFRLVLDAPTTA
jgi:hypothetical protein